MWSDIPVEQAKLFFQTKVRKSPNSKLLCVLPVHETPEFRDFIGEYKTKKGISIKKIRIFSDGTITFLSKNNVHVIAFLGMLCDYFDIIPLIDFI